MDPELIEYITYGILVLSFFTSAFCSASEISLMTLNRYRLKHLAKTEKYARRITKLLKHPDRLLGVILICNTFAATVCATLGYNLAEKAWGEIGIIIAPIAVTLLLLIFAEVMPKTAAAINPESIAKVVALPLEALLWFLYPIVRIAAGISNNLLRLMGVRVAHRPNDHMTRDELRTIVNEAKGFIPARYQNMLLSILDLEKVRVEHVMIPRNEVIGIDLDKDADVITNEIKDLQHTLLPIFRSDLDNIQGILHTRNIAKTFSFKGINKQTLLETMEEPYFVPEGTSLQTQLLNFQQNQRRLAIVVDEYGDVLGLLTLEDILEEIVGKFTTDVPLPEPEIRPQPDGSYLVDGGISVRELNRSHQWHLPTDGPTTLSGLIIETLETMPIEGVCVLIADHPIEIVEAKENTVKIARISEKRIRSN